MAIPLVVTADMTMTRGERAALIEVYSHGVRLFKRRGYAVDVSGPFHSPVTLYRLETRGLVRKRGDIYRPTRSVFA